MSERLARILTMPPRQLWTAIIIKSRSKLRNVPRPTRLPFGAWWLLRDDHIGQALRHRAFESGEISFVDRYLQPGMTVLDIGAHNGLYTLLASKRVGNLGRVYAFEPSVRERKALRKNLLINFRRNVRVQGVAVGSETKEAEFHLVSGSETGCNSLRPPRVMSQNRVCLTRVRVTRLDEWAATQSLERVDFIKLDVEGGERDVLRGGKDLLQRFRPVLLAEVFDIRTEPWGYPASEIIHGLMAMNYSWFGIRDNGELYSLDVGASSFSGNFVAWPRERLNEARVGFSR